MLSFFAKPAKDPSRNELWAKAVFLVGNVLGIVLLVALVGVWAVLQNSRFHAYALQKAEKLASERIGTKVTLQNFAVHLTNLSVDLYGLTVHGAEPYPDPPLLQVQHVELAVRIVSVWHRQWYLDKLRVDNPVARLFTDARGLSNIPTLNSSGNIHGNLFTLGVRHALLDHGELYYNDKLIPLGADLHDVDFRSSFDSRRQQYSGFFGYRNGFLKVGSFNPIPHDFATHFRATPKAFYLMQANFTSGLSRFQLSGTLFDYSHPNVYGDYEASLDGITFRQILRIPSIPAGVVSAIGSIEYRGNLNRPWIESFTIKGSLTSRLIDVRTRRVRAEVRNIAAHYSLDRGNLVISKAHANLLGGTVDAELITYNIAADSRSSLNLSLRDASMADLQRLAPQSTATKNIALGGMLTANVKAVWGKTLNDLVVNTDASLHADISRAYHISQNPGTVPLTGVINGSYLAAARQASLTNSYLLMPHTSFHMSGTLSQRSKLALDFNSKDLSELETVADLFRHDSDHAATPLGLGGAASFNGVVNGSTSAPHLHGELVVSHLQVKGTRWRLLRTNVEAGPSFIKLQHGNLDQEPSGSIRFDIAAGLNKWSFTKLSPIEIDLSASQLDLMYITDLVHPELPVEGRLTADLHLRGTELNPTGRGAILLTQATIYEQSIPHAMLSFAGTEGHIQGNLTVNIASGVVHGAFNIRPQQNSYVAQIAANRIRLAELHTLKSRNVNLSGSISLNATGNGTLNNPQMDASLMTSKLEIDGHAIDGLTLQMQVANHMATANLASHAIHSFIQATAKVNLTGDYFAKATLDTQAIPLQPLLAAYAPAQAVSLGGDAEIHATLRGPLKKWKQLEIHVSLPLLKVNYGNSIDLAATSPVRFVYSHGLIALQRTTVRGTDTDLQLQGSIPVEGNQPLSLLLLGTIDLQIAQLFDSDIKSSGRVRFNINSFGAGADPNIEGEVDVVDANFLSDDLPLGLQHGNGVLTLTRNRLNIKTFSANAGGGSLTAQGGVTFRPTIQFDIGVTAHDIRMLYPQGVREQLAGDLRLTGNTHNALLGGRVRVENLSFTPDFDLASFTTQISGGVVPPPTQGFSQDMRLNVAISSVNNLNLVSRTLSLDGTANLQVRGTAAQPVILGRVNLNDGDLIFNGNRFTVNGGTVEFVNPSETEPVVNIALDTTIQQYNIHLRFNGPVDQLRTNYASDPSLPAADIINLLAFGQTTEANAANPATPANQQAMGLVASQVSSQITSRVAKIAGISQLSINPVLAGGSIQGPAGAVVTIQQRVTGNLFVTFSTNVTTTQDQVIMGQYKVSPRVSLSVTRDQNGGVAFDTLLNRKW